VNVKSPEVSGAGRTTAHVHDPNLDGYRFDWAGGTDGVVRASGEHQGCQHCRRGPNAATAAQNGFVLQDPGVSRHHLRIEGTPEGLAVADLDSTNGTFLGAVRVKQIVVELTAELRLAETVLVIRTLPDEEEVPLAESSSFGALVGQSPPMRELFRKIEAASRQAVTVLLEGETGTGKELVAREIHEHSPRSGKPFVIVDCGAIPATLIEAELFGHARGAFTGAAADHAGAFEEADGGTVFLDEIGELDMAMQPRLLRALESGQIKRLGETKHRRVDVRIIAATNRDLDRAVNHGTFRPDLFYRLAVVRLRIPPLRERPEDVELLATGLLKDAARRFGVERVPALPTDALARLVTHRWPGNVRELRNFCERLVALSSDAGMEAALPDPSTAADLAAATHPSVASLVDLPYKDAKARWVAEFDVEYLSRLLERCQFNVAEAARRSGIDRVHLFRLIKKYGLRPG
jgi:DNA-binding NtrC family response regulator